MTGYVQPQGVRKSLECRLARRLAAAARAGRYPLGVA